MKRTMSLMVALCCFGLGIAAFSVTAEETAGTAKKACKMQSVFACPGCKGMAAVAGTCTKCEKTMAEKHVLGVKDGEAMVCDCPATCTCNAAGVKDDKCGCGKPVMKMSAKGMCVCPSGCPKISDKAGKCPCGKELKKVE